MNNFVAFTGIMEFVEGGTDLEADQSVVGADVEDDYQALCQSLVQIGKENLCLKKEKIWLEEAVLSLRK